MCLIPHLESIQGEQLGGASQVVAEACYRSEENYAYPEQSGVNEFIKYTIFDREQKRSWRKQICRVEN